MNFLLIRGFLIKFQAEAQYVLLLSLSYSTSACSQICANKKLDTHSFNFLLLGGLGKLIRSILGFDICRQFVFHLVLLHFLWPFLADKQYTSLTKQSDLQKLFGGNHEFSLQN